MYCHVVAALGPGTATCFISVLRDPPADGKYEAVKRLLLATFGLTVDARADRLLDLPEIGDTRPSVCVDHILALMGDETPNALFRALFRRQLPARVHLALASSALTEPRALAAEADKYYAALDTQVSMMALKQAFDFFLHSEVDEPKPQKPNRLAVSRNIKILERHSQVCGIEPLVLENLLRVIIKKTFTVQVRRRLLKCLVPVSVVPGNAPVIAVAHLCMETLPATLQVGVVQWLIVVFDLVENKDDFHGLYGMIFHFVQFENLSPYVCHLLYLLTRKEDVKRFRVEKLLRLIAAQGDNRQPHLRGLLSLYKTFRPDCVPMSVPSNTMNCFPTVNRAWALFVKAIQVKHHVRCGIEQPIASQGKSLLERRLARKRRGDHLSVVPLQQTGLSTDRLGNKSTCYIYLESGPELLENLDAVNATAQLSSLFGSTSSLCYLSCCMDEVKRMRIDYAIDQRLHVWDGETLQPQILNLLAQVPLCECSDLKRLFLRPLHLLLMTSSIDVKCAILKSLKQILLNWQTRDHPRFQTQLMSCTYLDDQGSMEARDAVVGMISFVDEIASILLQQEGYNSLLIHVLLSFYQTVGELWPRLIDVITIMPDCMIYPSFLSYDPSCLDHLCQIMCSYRENIITAKSDAALHSPYAVDLSTAIHTHNTALKRMMSCIWKGHAFHKGQGLGCFVDSSLPSTSSFCLCLPWHPALLGSAVSYIDAKFGPSENLLKDIDKTSESTWIPPRLAHGNYDVA
uniref:centromere protein I-like n=1 Tax=Myxine glutinosa TaxID=7769 RepID=UPI00358E5A2A